MAYSADSFVADEVPTTAKWNKLWNNDASFNDGTGIATGAITSSKISGIDKSLTTTDHNPYKFSAYRNAALTPVGTAKITFDAEDYDTNSNFDATTNNRYVAPVAGFYHFTAGANSPTPNRFLIYFYKNGSAIVRGPDFFNGVGSGTNFGYDMSLAVSDYVEVYINTSNNALAVGSGTERTYFQGYLISRT